MANGYRNGTRNVNRAHRLLSSLRMVARLDETRTVTATAVFFLAGTLFALLTARWLGPSERGTLVVFMTTSSFLMLLGALGVTTGGRVLLNSDPGLTHRSLSRLGLRLTGIHALTAGSIGTAVLAVSGDSPPMQVRVVFVVFAVSQLYNYFTREMLHGSGWHTKAVLGDALGSAVQTAGAAALYAAGQLSITTASLALLCGSITQSIWLSILARRVESRTIATELPWRATIRYSLPAMLTGIGQAFVIRGDRLLLGALAGTNAVGIYGVAATFTEVLWLIPNAVGQVAFRRASLSASAESLARRRRTVLVFTAVGGATLALVAGPAIDVLLGRAYSEARALTYLLIVASLPMASYHMDLAVLNGRGALRSGSIATSIGSLVLCAGCLASVPSYGAWGAAWSSMAAYSVMALVVRFAISRTNASANPPGA